MRPLAQPLLTAMALVAGALGYRHLHEAESAPPPYPAASPAPGLAQDHEIAGAPAEPKPPSAEPAPPADLATARTDAAAERINETTRQEVLALPELVRHLASADATIREQALEGILQLGDSAGVEPLRAAAMRARDPREAARLLDAADYLALPPAPPAAGTYQTVYGHREKHSFPAQGRASPAL